MSSESPHNLVDGSDPTAASSDPVLGQLGTILIVVSGHRLAAQERLCSPPLASHSFHVCRDSSSILGMNNSAKFHPERVSEKEKGCGVPSIPS